MVKKRALVEAAVKQAIDAVCKSGGGHPACPVVSGLLDLYLSSEFSTTRSPAPIGAGDRPGRPATPPARRDTISALVPERDKVPISVRRGVRPEETRDAITKLVQEHLQGSTTWTDLQDFFKQYGLPGPEALIGVIASKFLVRGLRAHIAPSVPIGAGGRITESIVTRITKEGVKRKLMGSRPRSYNPPSDFLG